MVLYPKEYFKSVKDISVEFLEIHHIQGLILDVDNTLLDYDKNIPEGIEDWCQHLKKQGIKCCILSNTNKKEKVQYIAKKLDIPYIFFAKKPLRSGFFKAKQILQLENDQIAVVGDQLFTDVLGANRSNMFSILVEPIEEKDIFITLMKRPIEKLILKQYLKKKVTKEK